MALAIAPRSEVATRAVRSFDELSGLAEAWTLLQQSSSGASVFSTWQWNRAVAKHFWDREALYVLIAEAAGVDGQPLGLLPLARRRISGLRGLAFLGSGPFEYGKADYQDWLVADGREAEVARAFVQQLHRDRSEWDVIMLQDVPESSRLLTNLPALAQEQGWPALQVPDNDVYWIPLPSTWEEYAAQLSTNVRSNLGRKQRKLEREHHARFERTSDAEMLEEALHRLFDLHNHRWQEKNATDAVPTIFSNPIDQTFHRELAHDLLADGMLDLTLLYAGDEVIGARYGFEYHGSASFYASGYRTDGEWGKFSLGGVMDLQSIRASIEAGLECEDLMRNEGEYKARYAPRRSDNQRLYLFRNRRSQLRYEAYQRLKKTAKRLLRR